LNTIPMLDGWTDRWTDISLEVATVTASPNRLHMVILAIAKNFR